MARRSRRIRSNKNEQAKESVDFLEKIFERSLPKDSQTSDTAARHILAIGKKHGKRPSREVKKKNFRSLKNFVIVDSFCSKDEILNAAFGNQEHADYCQDKC